jgi:hypothetical protein
LYKSTYQEGPATGNNSRGKGEEKFKAVAIFLEKVILET